MIDGGLSAGNLVCTWCGDRFDDPQLLNWHWSAYPEHYRNRFALGSAE